MTKQIRGWTATPKPAYRRASSSQGCLADARVAQLVEQRIENPRVGGSNPSPGTIFTISQLSGPHDPAIQQFYPALAPRGDMFVMGGDEEAAAHGLIDRAHKVHHVIG